MGRQGPHGGVCAPAKFGMPSGRGLLEIQRECDGIAVEGLFPEAGGTREACNGLARLEMRIENNFGHESLASPRPDLESRPALSPGPPGRTGCGPVCLPLPRPAGIQCL